MRRFLTMTVATVVGLVLLLSYRSGQPRLTAISSTGAGAGASPGPTPAASTSGSRTVDGPAIDTPFGAVQVRISVSGKKLVNIQTLQLPFDRSYSQQISAYVGPILIQEAVAAQSPTINAISGATYTSDGFAQSLQGAMQQAGLA